MGNGRLVLVLILTMGMTSSAFAAAKDLVFSPPGLEQFPDVSIPEPERSDKARITDPDRMLPILEKAFPGSDWSPPGLEWFPGADWDDGGDQVEDGPVLDPN